MSKKLFTDKEVTLPSKNKYVKNVTSKGITYTDEFKQLFIVENENGKLPRQIFEDAGFDTNILGMKRIKSSGSRWRFSYKSGGANSLQDTRKYNTGRPTNKNISLEEKYACLEAQNKLLKAENELLKKLEMIERRVLKGK